MTSDELAGQLVAVEVIAMATLGLHFANTRNDPEYKRAATLIEHLRESIARKAETLPLSVREHAIGHGNELLETVAESLRLARGEGGQLKLDADSDTT